MPGTLTLAFSGARDLWNSAWDNVRHLATTSTSSDMAQWLPQRYKARKEQPRLEAVTWLVQNASVTYSSKLTLNSSEDEKAIVGDIFNITGAGWYFTATMNEIGFVLPLKTVVRLSAAHQKHVRVGLYNATMLLPSRHNESLDLDYIPCVTILWPDSVWMHAHGWGASLNVSSCNCSWSALPYGCPVYMFDTYLPTERVVQPATLRDGKTLGLEDPQAFTNVVSDGCVPSSRCQGNSCDHRCSVLRVGSATIAAMPLPPDGKMTGNKFASEFVGTLRKMYAVATTFNGSVTPWCGRDSTASCSDPAWGQAHLPRL